jgi:EAL domain-containing protein (putative c-di-GMP-specific phosphodiesterase class I)
MYHAKTRGKNQCVRFVPEMRASVTERVELETDLRRAIEAREFVLHYQPIVVLATGEIAAVEALIRWAHPARGLLAPSRFIRIAEETGLIVQIGAWALQEACRQAAIWRSQTFPEGVMAGSLAVTVNVSGRQLQTPRIVADVRSALSAANLPPHALVIELTESVLTEQTEPVIATVLAIKALGIRLAIDDFGTGYASLSYLQRFPIDILKIAKPFVDDVAAETGRHGLAQAILSLGGTLGVRTIAEGIEQLAQSTRLQELGCELGQGFHFSHPLPADDLARLLTTAPTRPRGPARRSTRVRNVGVL